MLPPRCVSGAILCLLLSAGCVERPPVVVGRDDGTGRVPPAQQVQRGPPDDKSLPPSQRVYGRTAPAAAAAPAAPAGKVRSRAVVMAPQGSGPGETTIVRAAPGDTVYEIAKRNGVPLRTLLDLNRLSPPYLLVTGQPLALPRTNIHVVRHNETLYGISRRYGVDLFTLAQSNDIRPPYRILVGRRLKLPYAGAVPAPTQLAQGDGPAGDAGPPVVVLQSPDSAIADKGTAATAADGGAAAGGKPDAPATGKTEPPQPPPAKTVALEPGAGSGAAEGREAVPDPPARAGKSFSWPARGRILSSFGAKEGGLHNDGINIALPRGTPILAAENGVVVYAGNELRGYGNLLLLRHAGGYMTAYAHGEQLLVERGDVVRKGQIIARAGATGSVSTPQLHFEIRRGAQAVNPLQFLSSSAASLAPGHANPAAGPDGRQDPG